MAKTIAAGGVIERNLVKRKIRRMLKACGDGKTMLVLDELLEWLDRQPARTAKRKGGLGRK